MREREKKARLAHGTREKLGGEAKGVRRRKTEEVPIEEPKKKEGASRGVLWKKD